MRFTLTAIAKPARRLFRQDTDYDERQIVDRAGAEGFRVTRPNGDKRIRGSRRLVVWNGRRGVAWFEKLETKVEEKVRPQPISLLRGRLL